MFKKIFTIDYDRLLVLMLPTFLRTSSIYAFLECMGISIKYLYGKFTGNRTENLYKLSHNGQVCYLRGALNDSFDPVLRRIKLGDGSRYQRQYIYTNAERQPKYLGTMYLRQVGDYADTGVDFMVLLPDGFNLAPVINQMKATVELYKLASKRYKIQYENE